VAVWEPLKDTDGKDADFGSPGGGIKHFGILNPAMILTTLGFGS
jgi:hypothetical protein